MSQELSRRDELVLRTVLAAAKWLGAGTDTCMPVVRNSLFVEGPDPLWLAVVELQETYPRGLPMRVRKWWIRMTTRPESGNWHRGQDAQEVRAAAGLFCSALIKELGEVNDG